jgi:hypothetical protein
MEQGLRGVSREYRTALLVLGVAAVAVLADDLPAGAGVAPS